MAATYKDIMIMAKTLMAVHKEISKVWLRFKKNKHTKCDWILETN